MFALHREGSEKFLMFSLITRLEQWANFKAYAENASARRPIIFYELINSQVALPTALLKVSTIRDLRFILIEKSTFSNKFLQATVSAVQVLGAK